MSSLDTAIAVLQNLESQCERIHVQSPAGAIVWRKWECGEPLLLLHGGYGSWRHWTRNIHAFAKHRTLLVPDLPGLGDSDDVSDPVTPEKIACRLKEGLERLLPADGRRIDIVGFSFGALIGGHLSAMLGARVRSLTLVGAGALGLPRANIQLLKWQNEPDPIKAQTIHHANLARLMIAREDRIDDLAVEIQQQNTLRARVKSRRHATTDSLAQALRRSTPDLLTAIWGARDAIVDGYFPEREALLRSIRADVRFHVIPDAGHWVMYEAPNEFNALLEKTLDGVSRDRGAPMRMS